MTVLEKNETKISSRCYSYDIIRIIAILLVIMIHASGRILNVSDDNSSAYLAANIFDSFSRIGVPLFVMISGALMLNENKNNITIKKMAVSSLNIFKILMIWSLLYVIVFSIITPLCEGREILIGKTVRSFFFGHYHLWFLYMIIGLYLITPILRLFIKKENQKIILYFLLLSIAIKFCVPLINFFVNEYISNGNSVVSSFVNKFGFSFINEFLTYYIVGWYISNIEISNKQKKVIYSLGAVSLVSTFLMTQFLADTENRFFKLFYSSSSINVFLYAVCVFTFFCFKYQNAENVKRPELVVTLANLSFGVYLVHDFFLQLSYCISDKFSYPLAKIVFDFLFTATISFLVAFLLSKIPFIKKSIKC